MTHECPKVMQRRLSNVYCFDTLSFPSVCQAIDRGCSQEHRPRTDPFLCTFFCPRHLITFQRCRVGIGPFYVFCRGRDGGGLHSWALMGYFVDLERSQCAFLQTLVFSGFVNVMMFANSSASCVCYDRLGNRIHCYFHRQS